MTAEYLIREDGGIDVINRGFSADSKKWKEAHGKAYFVRERTEGFLKVSFFGPFYGSYIIFELDQKAYQYAFVTGPNKNYLWLLARTPTLDERIFSSFLEKVNDLGFNSKELIKVSHNKEVKSLDLVVE